MKMLPVCIECQKIYLSSTDRTTMLSIACKMLFIHYSPRLFKVGLKKPISIRNFA